MPGHPHTQSWSPKWILFRHGFSTHILTVYSLIHAFEFGHHCTCGCPGPISARLSIDAVLITQQDIVLSKFAVYTCNRINRLSADSVLITHLEFSPVSVSVYTCNLINLIVPVSCMWSRFTCPGPARCHDIHRHIIDHPAGYCSASVSVYTCILYIFHGQVPYISWDLNVVFTVPVDALAPWGAKPSADIVQIISGTYYLIVAASLLFNSLWSG